MTNPSEPFWDALMKIASSLEPAIAQGFLDSVSRMAAMYSVADLAGLLDSGQLDLFVDQVTGPQAMAPLQAAVQQSVISAGAQVTDTLINTGTHPPIPKGGAKPVTATSRRPASRVAVVFQGSNPNAVALAQSQGARLVQQVTDETRDTIRQIVANALKNRGTPSSMAKDIKQFIGLTRQQQQAVDNFRAMLESGDQGDVEEALTRALRDKRYDKILQRMAGGGAPPPQAKIDQMVEAYRQKFLTYRATTIARTESITALNAGQKAAWQQAVDQDHVDENDVRRYWHVARDERTCPTCMPVPRMNPDGRALDEDFQTPEGPVDGPSLHPRCRCTVFIKPFFST